MSIEIVLHVRDHAFVNMGIEVDPAQPTLHATRAELQATQSSPQMQLKDVEIPYTTGIYRTSVIPVCRCWVFGGSVAGKCRILPILKIGFKLEVVAPMIG